MFNKKLKEEISNLQTSIKTVEGQFRRDLIKLQTKFDSYVFKVENPNGELYIRTEKEIIYSRSIRVQYHNETIFGYSLIYKYINDNEFREIKLYSNNKNMIIEKYTLIPSKTGVYIGVQLHTGLGKTITKYYIVDTVVHSFFEINNDNKFENCEWVGVDREK